MRTLARQAIPWPPARWAPIALSAAALPVLLVAGEALARTGGGQDFSGGGGSGGGGLGGGSGGGGGGEIIFMLIWLVIRYPHIGIPVVLILGIGLIVARFLKGDASTRSAIRRLEQGSPPREFDAGAATRSLAILQSRDPAFDEQRFLSAVRNAFLELDKAWCDARLGDVRRFLSDGVMNRFQVLLDLNRRAGIRNVTAETSILDTRIASVESDDLFDTIHVRIRGRARDADVPLASLSSKASILAGRPFAEYVEYWSFVRRGSARTRPGQEPLEGSCPACGATLEVSDSVQCSHCRAIVNSAEHGWVLAEITQQSEWHQSDAPGDVPGLADLRTRDPELSRQAIEDRASHLFWKWVQALATYDTAPLGKVSAPGFVEQVARQVEGWRQAGSTLRMSKPAVGSVDLVACAGSPGDGDLERAYVKVRWSASWHPGAAPSPSTEMVVLARLPGSVTSAGLEYARCGNCGGPLPSTDAASCEYCGQALALDRRKWNVESIARPESVSIPRSGTAPARAGDDLPGWALPDLSDPRDRKAMLFRMIALVMADGVAHPREVKLLKSTAKRWGVDWREIAPFMEPGRPLPEIGPVGEGERGLFLVGLVTAALVDGRVDASERRVIQSVADAMKLPPGTADEMIRVHSERRRAA